MSEPNTTNMMVDFWVAGNPNLKMREPSAMVGRIYIEQFDVIATHRRGRRARQYPSILTRATVDARYVRQSDVVGAMEKDADNLWDRVPRVPQAMHNGRSRYRGTGVSLKSETDPLTRAGWEEAIVYSVRRAINNIEWAYGQRYTASRLDEVFVEAGWASPLDAIVAKLNAELGTMFNKEVFTNA